MTTTGTAGSSPQPPRVRKSGIAELQTQVRPTVQRMGPAALLSTDGRALSLPMPPFGTLRIHREELPFFAGVALLAVVGAIEWPIALVVAAGHMLAASRHSKDLEQLGEAMQAA